MRSLVILLSLIIFSEEFLLPRDFANNSPTPPTEAPLKIRHQKHWSNQLFVDIPKVKWLAMPSLKKKLTELSDMFTPQAWLRLKLNYYM